MALIDCPECGHRVSTAAKACPACGFPVAESGTNTSAGTEDELLIEVRPSWWRYFWWLVFAWLIVPLIVAWLQRAATVLRVFRHRITLRRGILSRCERELFIRDIRSIDIDQSFFQRFINIGDLTISSSATVDSSEQVTGIPHPHQIRDLIIAQRATATGASVTVSE